MDTLVHSRPRRVNAGTGVERLRMGFSGKGYGANREFKFVMNGKKQKIKTDSDTHYTYMQIACNVIFT